MPTKAELFIRAICWVGGALFGAVIVILEMDRK